EQDRAYARWHAQRGGFTGQHAGGGLPLSGAVRHRGGHRLGRYHGLHRHAGQGPYFLDDILLLFIYLELAAMVGIYFKTNHMPIRFMIYVAITALTRLLISDISHHHQPGWGVVMVSGAILLLALAILVVRFASA